MYRKLKEKVFFIVRSFYFPVYICRAWIQTFLGRREKNLLLEKKCKVLYASPVGRFGKEYLAKTISSFGTDGVDYLIFAYDDTEFPEPIFKSCTFIRESGLKWQFAKKYLTEAFCQAYDFIMIWDDDIDVSGFSLKNYLSIIRRNQLQLSQPALSRNSAYSHSITLKTEGSKIGRFTDFVEIMVPIFDPKAWQRYRSMITAASTWGWGMDNSAKSHCGFSRMGIVDSETVRHVRPLGFQSFAEEAEFLKRHSPWLQAYRVAYGQLK